MTRHKIFTVGSERFRLGPWHADHSIAYVGIDSGGANLSSGAVHRCVEHLAKQGFSSIITSALRPSEAHAFRQAGFQDAERLVVLSHDLNQLPHISTRSVRKARFWENKTVLDIDDAAFDEFWKMDNAGLNEALRATRKVRLSLWTSDERERIGYAICGLTDSVGYLQRLAVHPTGGGKGVGKSLVVDALKWLRRHSARIALVNTQEGNSEALALYEGLGFIREPDHLVVLRTDRMP